VIAPRKSLTTSPLGGSHQDYDPYFVGCFPDPFFESLFGGFGCGYSADSKCPPGYEEIYGDPHTNEFVWGTRSFTRIGRG